jgi:pilus assembly protein CpaF
VDSIRIPAHRLGVFTLATRIEEMLDLGPIDDGSAPDAALGARIDRALREEAAKLRAANEISPEVDLEAMARDAHEELLGLGPLQALLQEEDLLEIHVQGYSSILSVRASGARRAEVPFASDASMRRVLRRLCAAHGGRPAGANESVVERALGTFDADLLVVLEPVARDGAIAMIRRRPQAALSLEDLVRSGAMSRAMATFLGQVVANRRNVLVAGPPGAGMRAIVAALACSGAPGDRVLVVQSGSSPLPMLQAACAILVPSDGPCEPVVRAACRLRPDHLVVPYFEGAVASEVVDAIAAGAEGVVAAARAPSLRHALGRLVAQIATVRAGVPTEAVRESLLASFEVLVEYTRLRDGRTRVLRISEPAGIEGKDVALRDVFSFAAERVASGGAIEGSFHPTGVVPKLVEELAARGVPVEQGLFRR